MVQLLCQQKKNEIFERDNYGVAAAGLGAGCADDINVESQKHGRMNDQNFQEEEAEFIWAKTIPKCQMSSPVTRLTSRAALLPLLYLHQRRM
jgi:hypothetical protein